MRNSAKRVLMAVGATALAGVLALMVAPKAAHGVVAALVQVVNTSANPVPNLDVNTPAEEPLQAIICADGGSGACAANVFHYPSSFAVPTTTTDGLSVKRLVIENASGNCSGAVQVQAIGVNTTVGENVINIPQVTAEIPIPPQMNGLAAFSQLTRLYADAGATISLEPFIPAEGNFVCFVALNGYLVTK